MTINLREIRLGGLWVLGARFWGKGKEIKAGLRSWQKGFKEVGYEH